MSVMFSPNPTEIVTTQGVKSLVGGELELRSGSFVNGGRIMGGYEQSDFYISRADMLAATDWVIKYTFANGLVWKYKCDDGEHYSIGLYPDSDPSSSALSMEYSYLGTESQGLKFWDAVFSIEENRIGYVNIDTRRGNYNYLSSFTNQVSGNLGQLLQGALPSSDIIGTGGGATHIAKVTGLLSTLSSNLSDILAVAGGGGGGLISNETPTTGANGGGISGSGSNSADQSTGYAFGQGESSGGGSGLYGGYKAANGNSGGAGSGYIGNALLSNKKMVGYNVPTSSAESTKTESVNTYSATAESNKPKAGNGFVRITFRDTFPPSNWRKVETLLNSSTKDAIFNTMETFPDHHESGAIYWNINSSNILNCGTETNKRGILKKKIAKNKATKMYVKVQSAHNTAASGGSHYYLAFAFTTEYPNQYVSLREDTTELLYVPFIEYLENYNIQGQTPYYDLTETTVEISLSSIPSDTPVYLTFASCDETTRISQIYFDDEVAIEP